MERMFKITKLGRQVVNKMSPSNRIGILDFLYSASGRTATTSELEATTGLSGGRLIGELKGLERKGFIVEITGGAV